MSTDDFPEELIERIAKERPSHAIAPRWDDLRLLWSILRSTDIRSVLELGSGLSSVVMARAIAANGGGTVLSLETDIRWFSVNQATILPHAPGLVLLNVHAFCNASGCWQHGVVSNGMFDLIYVDGPQLQAKTECTGTWMVQQHKLLVIDGRKNDVALAREYYNAGRDKVIQLESGTKHPNAGVASMTVFVHEQLYEHLLETTPLRVKADA